MYTCTTPPPWAHLQQKKQTPKLSLKLFFSKKKKSSGVIPQRYPSALESSYLNTSAENARDKIDIARRAAQEGDEIENERRAENMAKLQQLGKSQVHTNLNLKLCALSLNLEPKP
jgi:hypothetical protein